MQVATRLLTYELATLPGDYPLSAIRPRADTLRSAVDERLQAIAGAPDDTTLADLALSRPGGAEPTELDELLSHGTVVYLGRRTAGGRLSRDAAHNSGP